MKELLVDTADRATRYVTGIGNRRVAPLPKDVARLEALGGPLPQLPSDPNEVLALLDDIGSPATVATTGGRYFGFVIGGLLPAALAASWLAAAWDQNASMYVMSPVAVKIEEIVLAWMIDLLSLPPGSGAGFVTGTTMANFSAVAAARTALLKRAGWDVEERGLFGAPPIRVVVGEEVHISVLKALSMLGLGRSRLTRVPVDDQGRMRADALPQLDDHSLICIQAGNVNTGAFDPAAEICARAREAGAWVHVDGAFGLWAAVSPNYAPLLDGVAAADSWAIDCHKWLNVPYDSGVAVVRDPEHLRAAMTLSAAYLPPSEFREPWNYVPEASRRARGIELWAAIRSLGRSGLRDMVERNCRAAKVFAERLREAGFTILNDVVLNQVLVSFGSPEQTRRVIAEIQRDGTCWCGGTQWQGHTAMRISVSCWATTEEDVERSVEAIGRIAKAAKLP
ncbi:MAG: aspartate aminotransferase family protein [Acidobacteriaceae bacterium]|nr:aspartate aminotransferase family protein [Acidobacteriaceae bacterium]MBV9766490.1 aspartate aminotransferase family protein [Acidobacteriaceae bacterium]